MGVVLASTVMAARVIGMVAVVNADLLPLVAIPMGAMGAAGLIGSAFLYRNGGDGSGPGNSVPLANPFELSSALKFGLMFTLILLFSKAATSWFGSAGMLAASAVAGMTDVDAVVLSMSQLARGEVPAAEAVTGIVVAAVSNTVVKAGMAFVLGGGAFGLRVGLAFLAMLAAGGAGLAWLYRG
jgi:uncharacterized membrane protein (DUF4010 family)